MLSWRAGVALPLAVTLQQLCLRAPRRSRAALSVLACIMFFLALICLGNPPSQPHPFWAPLEPTRSWDRYLPPFSHQHYRILPKKFATWQAISTQAALLMALLNG